jgi:PAS domain S-box-containing protein
MDVSRTLGGVFAAHRTGTIRLTREEANSILRRTLESNPEFLGVYTVWEPDAFDGHDSAEAGRLGSDVHGRFLPYWNRDPAGNIHCEPVTGYDKPGIGDFYLLPRKSRIETLVEPYVYPIRGENVLMTSLVVPIFDGTVFCGIVGVDLRVDFLQQLADSVSIYDNSGKLYLVTNSGVVAFATRRPELVGKVDPKYLDQYLLLLKNPQGRILENNGNLYAFFPIAVGYTAEPWAVILEVPGYIITAAADRRIRTMIIVAVFILLAGTSAMILLFRTLFVKRIEILSGFTRKFAEGNLDAVCELPGSDELSHLALSFNQMGSKIAHVVHELQQNKLLLTAVLDNAFQMYGLLTPDGKVITVNKAARTLINRTLDDARDNFFWDLSLWDHDSAEKDKARAAVADASSGSFVRFETTHSSADGKILNVDFSLSPLFDDEGNVRYLIAEGRDISSHKEAEAERAKLLEQLHHSRKMDAVGQLAGGVAHDFNNMLGGIMGAAELLHARTLSDKDRNKYLDVIITAAARAGELTAKLLAFSRKSTKASASVNVTRMISETVEILRRTIDKKIEIAFVSTADAVLVMGDDALLQSVFMNLGINASHAMPGGGTLTFTLRNVFLDRLYCDTSPYKLEPGTFIEIEVRDSGTGMSPEILDKIFEPFFTTKEQGKGTGLGLSAAYGTIQDHRGSITVNSEPGIGTVFHIYLPVSEDIAVHDASAETFVSGTGTILVIDDEEIIRVTAKWMLESLGYTVLTASDGSEGFRMFKDSAGKIDLVILDMVMPVAGGRETFSWIMEYDPAAKVILSSGFSKDEDLAEMKKAGLKGLIRKPFRIAELSRLIAETLTAQ